MRAAANRSAVQSGEKLVGYRGQLRSRLIRQSKLLAERPLDRGAKGLSLHWYLCTSRRAALTGWPHLSFLRALFCEGL